MRAHTPVPQANTAFRKALPWPGRDGPAGRREETAREGPRLTRTGPSGRIPELSVIVFDKT